MSPDRVNELGFTGYVDTDLAIEQMDALIRERYFPRSKQGERMASDGWSAQAYQNDAFDEHMRRKGSTDFLLRAPFYVDAQPENDASDTAEFEQVYREKIEDLTDWLRSLGGLTITATPVGEAD